MEFKHLPLLLFALALHAAPALTAAAPPASPITLYDLRYTLDNNTADPAARARAWDDCHLVAALQGLVNRDAPRLYINYIVATEKNARHPDENIDTYWWNKYAQPGQWLDPATTQTTTCKTIEQLVAAFRAYINGVVLYDPATPSTSNIASSVAGIENLLPIRYDPSPDSLYTRLVTSPTGPQLPIKIRLINPDGTPMFTAAPGTLIPGTNRPTTHSTKNDPYIWFIENYMKKGLCDTTYAGYYVDQAWLKNKTASKAQHTLTNHDYFIAHKALIYDLAPYQKSRPSDDPAQPPGTDLATYKELLQLAYNQNNNPQTHTQKFLHVSGYPPWSTKYKDDPEGNAEPLTIKLLGAYNAILDADAPGIAAIANCSFWQHFPTNDHYPQTQPWPTHDDLKKRGLLTPDGKVNTQNRDYIIFYVACFDNPAWTSLHTPAYWDDPNRGKLPLMWCVSPIIERRAPQVLHYWRTTATPNDYFAAGDNGAGYTSLGQLQSPRLSGLPDASAAWAAHNKPYYEKWDLTITGYIINTYAPPLGPKMLDAQQTFTPNGMVINGDGVAPAALYKNMPILKGGVSLTNTKISLDEAARRVVANAKSRAPLPFHIYRVVNESPTWYVNLMDKVHALNPNIILLDAPSYFELLRLWLQQNPTALPPAADAPAKKTTKTGKPKK